ncbi:hypothetical protein AMTR_s00030p00209850 [Amborella trichopoda]|uniref:Uncharacterized protein n=1 Tax=Amborella trichopoda TaxID=13333 RepID=U5D1N6_AMBTC|nr:hypothetical protein AMTR_s00030p00209850 [Amborella trichopoda]
MELDSNVQQPNNGGNVENGNDDYGVWNIDGGGGDHDLFARREAVLTKFHLKRKDRCFKKKVILMLLG